MLGEFIQADYLTKHVKKHQGVDTLTAQINNIAMLLHCVGIMYLLYCLFIASELFLGQWGKDKAIDFIFVTLCENTPGTFLQSVCLRGSIGGSRALLKYPHLQTKTKLSVHLSTSVTRETCGCSEEPLKHA
jgi:hypothetical protein